MSKRERKEEEEEEGDVRRAKAARAGDAPPSLEVAEEMERLRRNIEEGRIAKWNVAVSAEALRRVLEEMGSVESEELSSCGIILGSPGATALFGSMPPGALRVRRLDLFHAGIGDAGAESVARELEANITITDLNLDTNSITAAGARHLAGALRANATLRRLDLYNNDIGTGGVVALAEALGANGTLERLRVFGTYCDTEGVRALAGAVVAHPSLTGLGFVRGANLYAAGAQALAEMVRATRSLRRLSLRESMLEREPTLVFMRGLRHATSLTHLELVGCPLGDEGASELAAALSCEWCALVSVDVTECALSVAGATALAGALRVNGSLTRLELRGYNSTIGDEGARALFEALKHNRTLTALGMGWCELESLPGLAEALEANRTLAVLDLSGNFHLSNKDVVALAAALARQDCALEALDISDVRLPQDTRRVLADALATNTSLTTFRADGLTDGVKALIARNRRLREASAAQHEYLRSAAGLAAVPWVAEDVVANIVSEYAGRAWSELEVALHRRYGSHFFREAELVVVALREAL